MSSIAIGCGTLLVLLGVGGYVWTDRVSATALIPAAFGLVLVILGQLARQEHRRKHAMHAAAAAGLVGFLAAAVMGLPKLPTLISEGKVLRANGTDATRAVICTLVMALICAVFVGLCINSFIQARRRQAQSGVALEK